MTYISTISDEVKRTINSLLIKDYVRKNLNRQEVEFISNSFALNNEALFNPLFEAMEEKNTAQTKQNENNIEQTKEEPATKEVVEEQKVEEPKKVETNINTNDLFESDEPVEVQKPEEKVESKVEEPVQTPTNVEVPVKQEEPLPTEVSTEKEPIQETKPQSESEIFGLTKNITEDFESDKIEDPVQPEKASTEQKEVPKEEQTEEKKEAKEVKVSIDDIVKNNTDSSKRLEALLKRHQIKPNVIVKDDRAMIATNRFAEPKPVVHEQKESIIEKLRKLKVAGSTTTVNNESNAAPVINVNPVISFGNETSTNVEKEPSVVTKEQAITPEEVKEEQAVVEQTPKVEVKKEVNIVLEDTPEESSNNFFDFDLDFE